MKIKSFECSNNLGQYVDSMLFESGTCIAEMECECDNGFICTVTLEVRGEIGVDFNGVRYRHPSEFPPALRELIETTPGWWDIEDNVYIDMNNWFEYMYTLKDDVYQYTDGMLCEWDISQGTPEDIKKEMIEICEFVAKEELK